MTWKMIAAAAAAFAALTMPAQAETEFTQISPSIILMGEPAPVAETETAQEQERAELPDVLADGERREDGVAHRADSTPVAEDEKTSAVAAPSSADAPPLFQESELRRGG